MTLFRRLARAAKRVWRLPASEGAAANDTQSRKREAHAQLRGRLPAHLLKDIGADDG